MIVTKKFSFDLETRGISPLMYAVQGDVNTRKIEISLFSNGTAWEIPDGTVVAVAYRKPDGTGGLYDELPSGESASAVSGNVVTVMLAPQVLTCAGEVMASIIFYSKDMVNTLATFPFQIHVEKNPGAGEQISNNYYYLQNLDQVNAELQGLRVGYDGTIYSSAGEAVRGQIEQLGEKMGDVALTDNSVTPNMTTFFKKAVTYGNLYDKDNATNGICLDCVTGAENAQVASHAYTCPAFPVEAGKSYYVGRANGTMGQDMAHIRSWAYYDKDMNFVPAPVPSATGGWNPIPDGVAYMRVSVYYVNGNNNCMVVEGLEAPAVYVSHADSKSVDMGWKDSELREAILDDAKDYIEEGLVVDGKKITKQSIPITAHDSVIEYNLNLVNPDEVETGKSHADYSGMLKNDEYRDITGFIPVVTGRKYFCSSIPDSVHFYDLNKKWVEKIAWTSAANLLSGFEVPDNGFIRVSFATGETFAVNDFGMNWIPAAYGTKKLVYTDEMGTVFPQAVNDAGVVSAFEWKKVNLADENKRIEGNVTNGVFSVVDKWGNQTGFIVDVTAGAEYVFKRDNSNQTRILQYDENWAFVSEATITVEDKNVLRSRYTAPAGVAHIVVDCCGFFAEATESAIEIIGIIGTDTDTNLTVQYAPVGMAEYIQQIAAKTILEEQSVLLQKTIHKTDGLKWNCLGDSLTTLSWGTNMYNIVAETLGLVPTNYGIVSSTIADYSNDSTTGDPMCVRYANMDADADIVTVMGGTNDWAADEKVGTMADRGKTTLYGACHVLFKGLIEKYPNAKIAIILPPQNGQGVPSYVETQGGDPDMAYMRKKVSIIREVAEYYSLPVCDLFNHGGIPGILPSTINRLLQGDYLHITAEGYKVLSRPLLAFMRNLIG